jgi:hypothetical protein
VRGVYRHLGLADRLETAVQDPEESGQTSAELVLTYNALPLIDDWRGYLDRVALRSTRYLLVSVTSPFSYGVMIRKAMRIVERGDADELFDHPCTRPEVIEPVLKRYGRIVEHDFLDCPWWPDLFVETGETLLTGTLSRLPFGARFRRGPAAAAPAAPGQEPFLYGPGRFPFFGGTGWTDELEPALRRHPNLDGSRIRALASLLAHHRIRSVERT